MRTKWMQRAVLTVGLAALAGATANAQTDVALSIYGAFNGTTTGNNTMQSPANAAGGLLEVRHISHPWFGYEGTYAYNRANQKYSFVTPPLGIACPTSNCTITSGVVSANAHEVTADYIASLNLKLTGLRPFALAGGGLLLNVPSSGQTYCSPLITACTTIPTSNTTKPVFVYGAGVDWTLLPHIGLRLQYRGNLYKAPNMTKLFTSTSAFTHTAEPMIGAFFRF